MLLSRVRFPRLSLALATAVLAASLQAAGNFSSDLSVAQQEASGVAQLTATERAALDQMVADDLATSRQLENRELTGRFSQRHPVSQRQAAGLERLTPDQLATLDDQVAFVLASRPQPKDRPRLRDNEVVSLRRRLEVHGGMSFTYGWAGGGRNYRETAAWVSYFDPESGLGMSFGYMRGSGDPFYTYDPYLYDGGYFYRRPDEAYDVSLFYVSPNRAFELGVTFTEAKYDDGFAGPIGYRGRHAPGMWVRR